MPPIEWLEMCLSAFKKGLQVAPEAMEECQGVFGPGWYNYFNIAELFSIPVMC